MALYRAVEAARDDATKVYMNQTIKAIPTLYKGVLFRSRLEARWAVAFSAAGVDWQYEPEGFETSAGRYLPDFSIWNLQTPKPRLVEIKPATYDFPDFDQKRFAEIAKASFSNEFPYSGLSLICGDPKGALVYGYEPSWTHPDPRDPYRPARKAPWAEGFLALNSAPSGVLGIGYEIEGWGPAADAAMTERFGT